MINKYKYLVLYIINIMQCILLCNYTNYSSVNKFQIYLHYNKTFQLFYYSRRIMH